MPEGPTLLILRETLAPFMGRTVRDATGSARIDLARLRGERLLAIRTWGKHLLLCFDGFTVRVHLLLFGSCRIGSDKPGSTPTLALDLAPGKVNFYASSVKLFEGGPDPVYDWSVDVLSEQWDPAAARKKLTATPERFVCDALLDQDVFSGVGNIIKNEVLFRRRLHPLLRLGALDARARAALVREARAYSFDFLLWKRRYVLKAHLLVHRRKNCPCCDAALVMARLGRTKRWCHFCMFCQPPPAQ